MNHFDSLIHLHHHSELSYFIMFEWDWCSYCF